MREGKGRGRTELSEMMYVTSFLMYIKKANRGHSNVMSAIFLFCM